ncbi:hypothetical protein K466DRAFT_599676 [Polyporus arcularius HHB13444]|uniref:Uncharacterized protein n=1 Tax=Polyporus arcularius HHB13444 TaxID=1314778 RepID=A0A5C3PG91_9APHY|nr:hypothetical protein K466DRAFT_599676 [Polyporus arcularius HHB13444]
MADADSIAPNSSSTPPTSSSTGYGPVSVDLNEIDLGVRKVPAPTGWTDILAVPILGAAYFIHWRYRRYAPRRIPTLTSLRLAEVYATGGAAWMVFREEDRLERQMMQDRDLMTIEASNPYRITSRRTKHASAMGYPSDGDLAARLRWWYNHIWSGPVEWNLAFASISPDTPVSRMLSWDDLDICFTHIANTMREPGNDDTYVCGAAVPAFKALCGVTPFAMLARWAGRRMFWLPLNVVQRALFYATVGGVLAQDYQHASYLWTIRDKSAIADLLRANYGPEVERNIDSVCAKWSDQ